MGRLQLMGFSAMAMIVGKFWEFIFWEGQNLGKADPLGWILPTTTGKCFPSYISSYLVSISFWVDLRDSTGSAHLQNLCLNIRGGERTGRLAVKKVDGFQILFPNCLPIIPFSGSLLITHGHYPYSATVQFVCNSQGYGGNGGEGCWWVFPALFYEDMRGALASPLSSWSMDFPGSRAVKRKGVDQLVEN